MNYLIMVGIIFILWVLIFFISANPLIQKYGKDDPYARKAVENGKNTLSCLAGVVGIFVTVHWIPFLKWIVLVFYVGVAAWELIISTMFPIITGALWGEDAYDNRLCLAGNFFQAMADATVAFFCMRMCFGWI